MKEGHPFRKVGDGMKEGRPFRKVGDGMREGRPFRKVGDGMREGRPFRKENEVPGHGFTLAGQLVFFTSKRIYQLLLC